MHPPAAGAGIHQEGYRRVLFTLVAVVPSTVDIGLLVILRHGLQLPLIAADGVAIGIASCISYAIHRLAADRSNPYSRWTENPLAFLLVAISAGIVDIAVLRLAFIATGFSTLPSLLLAKTVAMCFAAPIRIGGYRLVLAEIVRVNRARNPRPLESKPFRMSVVVPAFWEQDRIHRTVLAIRAELHDMEARGGLEVIVVDDGSGDETPSVARSAGADQVLVLDENRGKGAAVRAGVLAARGSVVCFTDADLAYHPRHLRSLLTAVESGWDVAIGSRQHPESRVTRQSRLRSIGSQAVNRLSAIVLLDAPLDTQSGLKGFRSDVARSIFLRTRLDGFSFDIEVLHLVERAGWSLQEIPVHLNEAGGSSTVRVVRDAMALAVDMVRIRHWSSSGIYAMDRPRQALYGEPTGESPSGHPADGWQNPR